jgi:adiponectin receptor
MEPDRGRFDPYKFPVGAGDSPSHAVYPCVTGRYRSGGSYVDNLWSLFRLHTETVNCWTMIIMSLLSVTGTTYVVTSSSSMDPMAVLVFGAFTSAAVIHLPFSVGYHLFTSMRRQVFNRWRRYDIVAIFNVSVLLTFSLSFYVLPWWGCLMNTVVAGIVAARNNAYIRRIPDELDLDPAEQSVRVASIVLCYWFPMALALGRDALDSRFTVSSAAALGVLAGLVSSSWAYSTAWPQRLSPGSFDVWGHSHQLMHVGVMVCHVLEFAFIWDNWQRSHCTPMMERNL